MLRTTKEMLGYTVKGFDDTIGTVDDFFFLDDDFHIRYLVVQIGAFVFNRKVLITPDALGEPDWVSQQFPVNLTKKEIKGSPDIKTNRPISAMDLERLHDYYRWPKFWTPLNPAVSPPKGIKNDQQSPATNTIRLSIQKQQQLTEPKLRSMREIIGYRVKASDGTAGRVIDTILNDQTWKFHYVVINTGSIFNHKKVLLAVDWINLFQHRKSQIQVDMPVKTIEDSPEFDPNTPMTHRREEVYYEFHGKPYYWVKR